MYRLKSNVEKLEAVLDTAVDTNQLDISVFYTDLESTQKNAYSQFSVTNDNNYVTILNPPGQSVIREADTINIVNKDLDVLYISVYYNINGTRYLLYRALLDVGDNLEYTRGYGWKTINSGGSFKGIGPTGATGPAGPPGPGTDLSIGTITATTVDINSSTGTDATIPQATTTDAGLLSASDKDRIDNTLVESVNGLDIDNSDPQNPVLYIAVDGSSITGAGTPISPITAEDFIIAMSAAL